MTRKRVAISSPGTLEVRANVVELAGFSAHADRGESLRRLGTLQNQRHLNAVRAEPESAAAFAATVRHKFGFAADVAVRGTAVSL